MGRKKLTYKEKNINGEEKKLREVFQYIDKNMLKTVDSLIQSAAFMAVSIKELEEKINEKGYTEEYQNGEKQKGIKKRSEVEIHISMMRNYSTVIKQLIDLVPPEKKAGSKLEALKKSI